MPTTNIKVQCSKRSIICHDPAYYYMSLQSYITDAFTLYCHKIGIPSSTQGCANHKHKSPMFKKIHYPPRPSLLLQSYITDAFTLYCHKIGIPSSTQGCKHKSPMFKKIHHPPHDPAYYYMLLQSYITDAFTLYCHKIGIPSSTYSVSA